MNHAAILLFSLSTTVVGAERKLVDRVAAVVNDEVITLSELEQAVAPFLSAETTDEQRAALHREAVDRLIADKLLGQQIREARIDVSPDDVDRAIEDICRQNNLTRADLEQAIESRGMTMAKYRRDLEQQLIRLKLVDLKIRSRVVVPETDVRAEWERQSSREKRQKLVRLRHLFFAWAADAQEAEKNRIMERAGKARDRVAKGEPFATVAKELSEGPTASDGGDLGWLSETNLLPELARAMLRLKKGELSQPIETSGGAHVLLVEDTKLEESTGFEEARGQIYQRLYQEESERQMKLWLDEVRAQSAVQVRL